MRVVLAILLACTTGGLPDPGSVETVTVSGTFTEPGGRPAWARVSLRGADRKPLWPVGHIPESADGRDLVGGYRFGTFRFEVPPGTYVLRIADRPGTRDHRGEIEVGPEGVQDLAIELEANPDARRVTRLRVLLREGEAPASARLSISLGTGRAIAPRGMLYRGWRAGTQYVHVAGGAEFELRPGTYDVSAIRGTEYRRQTRRVEVGEGETAEITLQLERWIDLAAMGWISGETHIHHLYDPRLNSVTAERFVAKSFELQAAEDLRVGGWLLCPNNQPADDRGTYGRPPYFMKIDQEPRNSTYGHVVGLLLDEPSLNPIGGRAFTGGLANPSAAELPDGTDWPLNSRILEEIQRAGGVGGYAHPLTGPSWILDRVPALNEEDVNATGVARELPVDAALGLVRFLEVYSYSSDHGAAEELWYHLLRVGFDVAAAAGTDSFNGRHSRTGPPGGVRCYVQFDDPEEVDYRAWVEGMLAGRTFLTTSPALFLEVDGNLPGQCMELPAGGGSATAKVLILADRPVHTLSVKVDGVTVHEVSGPEIGTELSFPLAFTKSTFVTASVEGGPQPDIPNGRNEALTGPVFVTVDGQPRRSAESAEFFIRWIDELQAILDEQARYPQPGQRELARKTIARGRAVYEEMLSAE